jgi:hypothetical protein
LIHSFSQQVERILESHPFQHLRREAGLGSNTEGINDPHRVDDLPIHTLRLWGGCPYVAADGPDRATNNELARDGKGG